MKIKKEAYTCDFCGKEFKKYPSQVTGENTFCSVECKGEWQKENLKGENNPAWNSREIECLNCGKKFERPPCRESKFCSPECQAEWRSKNLVEKNHWSYSKEKVECDWCGKIFRKKPSQIYNHNFCSEKCYGKWYSENMRGKENHRWEGGKVTVTCEYCGRKFEVCQAKANQQRFCSRRCFFEAEKEPTSAEKRLNDILQEHFPGEWKYVGDGKVWIDHKCPDFINCNGSKKIIEMFGDYWHSEDDILKRKEHFSNYGYETLVIWEHELENEREVVNRLKSFNYKEVIS